MLQFPMENRIHDTRWSGWIQHPGRWCVRLATSWSGGWPAQRSRVSRSREPGGLFCARVNKFVPRTQHVKLKIVQERLKTSWSRGWPARRSRDSPSREPGTLFRSQVDNCLPTNPVRQLKTSPGEAQNLVVGRMAGPAVTCLSVTGTGNAFV